MDARNKIKALVFEGIGVGCVGYGGFLAEADTPNVLPLTDIKATAGASSGALTALIVGLGYTGQEILELMQTTNFAQFADQRGGLVGDIERVVSELAIFNNERLEAFIKQLIAKKLGDENATFADAIIKSDKKIKDMYFTATMMSKSKVDNAFLEDTVVFSFSTTPNTRYVDAVMASMALPPAFPAIRMKVKENGNTKNYSRSKKGYHFYDGGMKNNFPYDLLVKANYDADEILGFIIASNGEIVDLDSSECEAERVVLNTKQEQALALLTALFKNEARTILPETNLHNIILIPNAGLNIVNFWASSQEINRAIKAGKTTAEKYKENLAQAITPKEETVPAPKRRKSLIKLFQTQTPSVQSASSDDSNHTNCLRCC